MIDNTPNNLFIADKNNTWLNEKPSIEITNIPKGTTTEKRLIKNTVIFVRHGELTYYYNNHEPQTIIHDNFMALPADCILTYISLTDASLVTISLNDASIFRGLFVSEKIEARNIEYNHEEFYIHSPGHLPINKLLHSYLDILTGAMNEGLNTYEYLELKTAELLYLLKAGYSNRELRRLFGTCFSSNACFTGKILNTYYLYDTVGELAASMNMSLYGFRKRFRKIFGMPAYKWMKQQKAKVIYNRIINESISFKELAWQYGFAGPSQLNDFCKKNFGLTPGEIRMLRK